MLALTQTQAPVKTTEDAMRKQYEFWSTQPVPKIGKILVLFIVPARFTMILPCQMRTLGWTNLLNLISLHQKFARSLTASQLVLFGTLWCWITHRQYVVLFKYFIKWNCLINSHSNISFKSCTSFSMRTMLKMMITCSVLIILPIFCSGKLCRSRCFLIIELTLMLSRALKPPGWLKEWHCGVRVEKSGKLVGFISAIPANIRIYKQ